MAELPRIISVDDHVVEPPDVFTGRLPKKYADRGPRLVRKRGTAQMPSPEVVVIVEDESPNARWSDVWVYEDLQWPMFAGHAQARLVDMSLEPRTLVTYDEFAPGCYQKGPRLK